MPSCPSPRLTPQLGCTLPPVCPWGSASSTTARASNLTIIHRHSVRRVDRPTHSPDPAHNSREPLTQYSQGAFRTNTSIDLPHCAFAMAMLWASPRPLLRPVVPRKLSLHGPTLRTCIQRRGLITLGIETSCDDTCVAVLDTKVDGTRQTAHLRTDKRVTCANKHHQGVHPVEAVESHTRNLPRLLNEVLKNILKPPPDLIAVTRGPGMKPCLNVGVSFAKGLSVAWGVPLIGVHHMQAHALTPHLEAAVARRVNIDAHEPQYPFLTLLYGSTPPPPKPNTHNPGFLLDGSRLSAASSGPSIFLRS